LLVALTLPATATESIAAHLLPMIYEHSVDDAIAEYRTIKADRRGDFAVGERHLRRLGYILLRDQRFDDAEQIFLLNTEEFPMSPRARYDLATCHARRGATKKARTEYQRARWMLDRLRRSGRLHDPELQQRIAMQLIRLDSYPVFDQLVGVYRTDDGRLLSISIAEPDHGTAPPQLRLVEFPSGRARTLHRNRKLSYFTGPGLGLRSPVEQRFEFVRGPDEVATSLLIRGDDADTTAVRMDVRSEDVSFDSGDVALEGTLLRPATDAPAPAVILVHGSGKATRNSPGLGELAHFLVLNGYAVLRYDKRGWGASSMGDTETAVLRHLAIDALSAYRYLEERPDIDATRIGFAGFSEGAWVAGIAASNPVARPAFLVLLSGGGLEPWRQERYRVEAELRAEGFTEAQVAEAVDFLHRKFDVARTGNDWPAFADEMKENRLQPWYKYVLGWPSLPFARMAWEEVLRYQPRNILRGIRCPVLALLGEKDIITPPRATASALEDAFADRNEDLLEVHFVENGNHLLLEAEKGSVRFTDEVRETTRYAGGYFETLGSWLAGSRNDREVVATSAP
jgi:pimeloyl-ACP methyl ester carboxylesterase